MRTRIALVAITSIAVITVTLLTQAVTMQPARASIRSPHHATILPTGHPADQLTSYITTSAATVPPAAAPTATTLPDLGLGVTELSRHPVVATRVAPVPAPAPVVVVVVDTVTPDQRAAWDRVAMCEEGGNWQSGGSRFSGGLGVTRANWANYGGLQYAPEGAMATPDQQIMVAERIQSSPPDQYGCRSW
jgi:hypothetical protein